MGSYTPSYAPSKVLDRSGNVLAILPTWSDGGILAEALGLSNRNIVEAYFETGRDGDPLAREQASEKGYEITDASGLAAIERLRGADYMAAFRRAYLETVSAEDRHAAMREFYAKWLK